MINQVQTNMKGKNKGQANLQKKKDQTLILIQSQSGNQKQTMCLGLKDKRSEACYESNV